MLTEKSAGAVIFHIKEGKIFYLLLHYPSSPGAKKEYWGFSKGHMEKNETIEQAARREIQEETGLKDINLEMGFQEEEKYFFMKNGKKVFKIVTFLLGLAKTKKITISFEHVGFLWLSYNDAFNKLTFKNGKEILKKADNFLINLERRAGKNT
ncbi:MAG: NUDIX domain-containing protein [bacterium]|nr:NUDIX domain-containing protein [bacterium]